MEEFLGTLGRQPELQLLMETSFFGTFPSMTNLASVIDLVSSSGLMVAWRSKRWSGKNRAITGFDCPELKSSLGGVKRVTTGCENAACRHANAESTRVDFLLNFMIRKIL